MTIRVFIQTGVFQGGPAVFRSRLIKSFKKIDDIKVVKNVNEKFDIELAFIRQVYEHDKPYILRADGCYYEENRKNLNKNIKEAMKKARYIIFQSESSFKLCDHVLGIEEKMKERGIGHSIIHNGIDLEYIKKIKPAKDVAPGSFITCAGWRPNKRPNSTIEGFIRADTGRYLYIIGEEGFSKGQKISKNYWEQRSKYIKVLGKRKNKEIISIMKTCSYQLHLCHIDSCPNAVIEGLSCGLNVLYTNLGGTYELVKENGVVLNVDKPWKTKYMKSTNLDNISPDIVAEGIHKLLKMKERSKRKDLDIDEVAKEYANVIKKVWNV
ncbi:hypothetical protein LCGC14_1460630 [marine sediment metagenome]|uniref:Glycosyl transferase family 1 domain-containing protein n=1 Tax=marine sediment metagenome TaxID=412755 RepID=A0A0F9LVT9_9ZZZZ